MKDFEMMPENPDQRPLLRPPVGNLTDFVEGVDEKNPLDIEVAVNENGKIVVFHNRKFRNEVSWFEFDLGNYALDFVMDEGEIRNAGVALTKQMAKYMQNSHQILMVLLDNETGQAAQGNYIPLIIHQN